jgi:hypothetical protein
MLIRGMDAVFVAACIGIGLLPAGCGRDKAPEEPGIDIRADDAGNGFAMEIRGDDGETARVEISGGDAGSFSMRIDGGEEGLQMRMGSHATLPEAFPSDVPVYDGLVLRMVQKSDDGFVIQGLVKDEIDTVAAFYKQRVEAQGWKEEMAFTQSGAHALTVLGYSKGDRTLNISIGREDDQTSVMIATNQ